MVTQAADRKRERRPVAAYGLWRGEQLLAAATRQKDWVDLYGSVVSAFVSVCDGIVVFNLGATREQSANV